MAGTDKLGGAGVFTFSYRDESGTARSYEWAAGPGVELVIGRASTCGLVIKHASVSRQHARVSVRGDACYLVDNGSTHGTFLRGSRLAGEARIHAGDTFTVGQVEVTIGEPDRHATASVALSDERQVIDAAIFRRVDDPEGVMGTAGIASRSRRGDAIRITRLLSEIGRTLVTVQSPAQVLERVIDLVFESLPAERAILMLRESPGDRLTPTVVRSHDGCAPGPATVSRTVVNRVMRDRVAMLATDAANDTRLDGAPSIQELRIRSFMCAPLWNHSDVIGVLYTDTPRSARFSEDDLEVFTAIANYAAVAIEQARLTDHLLEETRRRERLQRYHSPGVVDSILTGGSGSDLLPMQPREVSILFADIVAFTTMAESMEPGEVAETLNAFFAAMTEVIFEHDGTLDKFLGDAVLAVFGAPFELADHARHAVRAAIQMRKDLAELNARRGGTPIGMRVAIHSGSVLAGDVGSPRRREFTVLGDTVNTASRLQATVAEPGQIVISRETRDQLGDEVRVRPIGPVALRGRRLPIEAFSVDD